MKLPRYWTIPSLQHVLLVRVDRVHVGLFSRLDEDIVRFETFSERSDEIPLRGLNVSILVGDLYRDIDLPPIEGRAYASNLAV